MQHLLRTPRRQVKIDSPVARIAGIAHVLEAADGCNGIEQTDDLEPYAAVAPAETVAQPGLAAFKYRLEHARTLLEYFIDQMPGRRCTSAEAEHVQFQRFEHTIRVVAGKRFQYRFQLFECVFHLEITPVAPRPKLCPGHTESRPPEVVPAPLT